ncbi:FMN-binding glutamate synthase family protein [Corynebacterium terpenotabidum]|uniref:Putative glutamate synthase n=1 Tax=Corynebacterium terpenotabidum Y-11 TaxID=1200352 RepID=S4XIN5_9CORY|nr:FMN-binding glutamate synthase family protein [Corynebacterium terpenotabidum]AGP31600.1 putative glutamate synthase [Corynebacterium terpenotabidum Y-11]
MTKKNRLATKATAAAVGALATVAVADLIQPRHSILRNYPVAGYARFLMEKIRPEIQQYFIERNFDGEPFDRNTRTMIYRRAKGKDDHVAFGTERDLTAVGYESLVQSLAPLTPTDDDLRITVGGPDCTQPYSASRFNISAMSFGALSARAVLAMNKGAAAGGFLHDTGEGGLTRYHLTYGADLVWELGSGYYSTRTPDGRLDRAIFATTAARPEVKMIEIKLSQGAKPGIGGMLPKEKITEEVSEVRGVPRDRDCISPPAHPEFSTPRELVRFVAELRELAGGKPVGIKLCLGDRAQFLGICRAMLEEGTGPDFITVDGAEGGTGSAPLEFQDSLGMHLSEGLMTVQNALVGTGLRDRVTVGASGKIAGGADIVRRMIQGADITFAARPMMMAVGCIQAQKCNTGNCPVGVATQDPLRQRAIDIDDKGERVHRYHDATVREVIALLAAMGVRDPADLSHDMARVVLAPGDVRTFTEAYRWLAPGQLLGGDAPADWARDWERADADSFGR